MVNNFYVNKVSFEILLQPFIMQRRHIRKVEKHFLPGPVVAGLWGIVLNSLDIRMKVMRCWNRLPREGVDAPSWEVFSGALGSLEVLVGCSFEQLDLLTGRLD